MNNLDFARRAFATEFNAALRPGKGWSVRTINTPRQVGKTISVQSAIRQSDNCRPSLVFVPNYQMARFYKHQGLEAVVVAPRNLAQFAKTLVPAISAQLSPSNPIELVIFDEHQPELMPPQEILNILFMEWGDMFADNGVVIQVGTPRHMEAIGPFQQQLGCTLCGI